MDEKMKEKLENLYKLVEDIDFTYDNEDNSNYSKLEKAVFSDIEDLKRKLRIIL